MHEWACCGCGVPAPDRKPPCDCPTRLVFDRKDAKKIEFIAWHEWTEIKDRRWCNECGSFQVRKDGKWRDTMVGPYPAYNKTDPSMHYSDQAQLI